MFIRKIKKVVATLLILSLVLTSTGFSVFADSVNGTMYESATGSEIKKHYNESTLSEMDKEDDEEDKDEKKSLVSEPEEDDTASKSQTDEENDSPVATESEFTDEHEKTAESENTDEPNEATESELSDKLNEATESELTDEFTEATESELASESEIEISTNSRIKTKDENLFGAPPDYTLPNSWSSVLSITERQSATEIAFIKGSYTPPAGASNYPIPNSDGLIAYYEPANRVVIHAPTNNTIYASADASRLFYDFYDIVNITNLSYLNTSNVATMSDMFAVCHSLTSLDLSSFNTSNVTNMSNMFNGCSSLTNLDLSNFNTSNVTLMEGMFAVCNSLTSLDLSSFNTSNVTLMDNMFGRCSSLTSLDLSSFNTSSVTNMYYMFFGCSSLTSLGLSSFNTSNVTVMGNMFNGCSSLTNLDLSSFNTSNVTGMRNMFSQNYALTRITASSSFVTTSVTSSDDMFRDCRSLIGSHGTTLASVSNVTDKTYAFIDGGVKNPGLFYAPFTLQSFTVVKEPLKTTYNSGEAFDPTGLIIKVTYSDGVVEDIDYATHKNDFSFDPNIIESTCDVSITYLGLSGASVHVGIAYPIKWELNGSKWATGYVGTSSYIYGEGLVLPEATKLVLPDKKEFLCWAVNGKREEEISKTCTGAVTVTLIYTDTKTYGITWNLRGGHFIDYDAPDVYYEGVEYILPNGTEKVAPPKNLAFELWVLNSAKAKAITKIEKTTRGAVIIGAQYKKSSSGGSGTSGGGGRSGGAGGGYVNQLNNNLNFVLRTPIYENEYTWKYDDTGNKVGLSLDANSLVAKAMMNSDAMKAAYSLSSDCKSIDIGGGGVYNIVEKGFNSFYGFDSKFKLMTGFIYTSERTKVLDVVESVVYGLGKTEDNGDKKVFFEQPHTEGKYYLFEDVGYYKGLLWNQPVVVGGYLYRFDVTGKVISTSDINVYQGFWEYNIGINKWRFLGVDRDGKVGYYKNGVYDILYDKEVLKYGFDSEGNVLTGTYELNGKTYTAYSTGALTGAILYD